MLTPGIVMLLVFIAGASVGVLLGAFIGAAMAARAEIDRQVMRAAARRMQEEVR